MTLFSGQNLTCHRGGRIVFEKLDFVLDAGGVLILVGPNGSGKSSLLRVMSGLLRSVAGAVLWSGEVITDEPEAHNQRLHYVGHLDAVKPAFTAAENIAFWAGLRDVPADVPAALGAFGICHLAEVPGRLLSAGQKRRVNLARIISTPAPLWLLDEPATALDSNALQYLRNAVIHHCDGGGMVVVSTHVDLVLDGVEAMNLADFKSTETAL